MAMASTISEVEYGLHLTILSFYLSKHILKPYEDYRVSITTLPEHFKQHFVISPANIANANHEFKVNISAKTKNIVVVFRKNNIFAKEPIIASATIHQRDFPTLTLEEKARNSKILVYQLSSPHQNSKDNSKLHNNNKNCGIMQVQFSLGPKFEAKDSIERMFVPDKQYQIMEMHSDTNELPKLKVGLIESI